MAENFSLKEKFQKLYDEGQNDYEIAHDLKIDIQTIRNWRTRRGLPQRRNRALRSWMDIPLGGGHTPREVLQSIAKPLGITAHDIEFILTRVDKLKTTGVIRGRNYESIILTAAFLYLRWQGSQRRPMSVKKFIEVTGISKSRLLMTSRLFKAANLYPKHLLQPEELLEGTWSSLKQRYAFPDTIKTETLKLIEVCTERAKRVGRTPTQAPIVAACVYIVCNVAGIWITQEELADIFGVTTVSIRSIRKMLDSCLNGDDVSDNTGFQPSNNQT